ncbi:MAG: RDD family protein [Pseudomonadota bacterium]
MQSNQELKYVGSLKRSFAAAIDILIANIIRMAVVMVLSALWMNQQIINFWNDFKAKFDSDFIGKDPEKIQFLMQHTVFKSALLFCFIVFMSGALYYVLMNCSKWRGGVGKKLMKIVIVKNDGTKLTFLESAFHYFLSIVPWFFVFYIFTYQMMHGINIYKAITENTFNLIFGLITLAWLQIHMVTKKKTTAADLICKTIVVEK